LSVAYLTSWTAIIQIKLLWNVPRNKVAELLLNFRVLDILVGGSYYGGGGRVEQLRIGICPSHNRHVILDDNSAEQAAVVCQNGVRVLSFMVDVEMLLSRVGSVMGELKS
jgi:hypothetical protein